MVRRGFARCYNDFVLPRMVDVALGSRQDALRRQITSALSGNVVEIGFGSGRNLANLPATVTKLFVSEPAGHALRLAAPRIAASGVPVEHIGADAARLALGDESVDHVLVTWSLCTIPDVTAALREAQRVLRPGGRLHFVEHGRSTKLAVARRQDRLTPLWRRVAGGCHLNRDIPALVADAGFTIADLATFTMTRPEVMGHAYLGVAQKGERDAEFTPAGRGSS